MAAAIAADPKLVICDKPTSSLDLSVQAAILNLLADIQSERNVVYIFISHDLGVVRYMAERVAVLYLGRVRATVNIPEGPRRPLCLCRFNPVRQLLTYP